MKNFLKVVGVLLLISIAYGLITEHGVALAVIAGCILLGILINRLMDKKAKTKPGEKLSPEVSSPESSYSEQSGVSDRVRKINLPPPNKDSETFSIILTDNTDEKTQKELRDLRIRIESGYVQGKLTLEDNDNDITFFFSGQKLGKPNPQDTEWLLKNYDDIKPNYFYIRGGVPDYHDEPVPFKVQVTGAVTPGKNPPTDDHNWIPILRDNNFPCNGDDVVYVSSTGKIHLAKYGYSCGANLDHCTPMLYSEAISAGHSECMKCFK